MSSEAKLEQRVAEVEAAVRELQRLIALQTPAGNWLDRVTGSMKDEPAFAEVLEYSRAIREADRPPEAAAP